MADLLWAQKHFTKYGPRYEKFEHYYNGDQPLAFVSRKMRNAFGDLFLDFADNQCKPVVDIFAARVVLTGFTAESDPVTATLDDIYRANKLNLTANRLHSEAIKLGDSFAIVWPNEAGVPTVYPQKTENVAVRYEDNGDVEEIAEAVKVWCQEANGEPLLRVTRYLPEEIQRYWCKAKKIPASTADLHEYTDDGQPAVVANPYGRVPIFHFSNSPDPDDCARSEIKPVIPIQNALNKACVDMLVAMEFCALPQRYATGLEVPTDAQNQPMEVFKAAVDRLWTSPDPQTQFGQFPSTNLEQFLAIQNDYRQEICRITSTPAHLLFLGGDFPSGEALKTASEPMTIKVNSIEEVWGETWEALMKFALEISGRPTEESINVVWADTSPQSEKEQTDAALKKQMLGVTNEQLQRELGYEEDQIAMMAEQQAMKASTMAEMAIAGFNSGNTAA